MTRRFVGFDDSYRVPVPVNVSRGVLCGPHFHVCGQLHMDGEGRAQDAGDLEAQTVGTMRRLYDVFGHARVPIADMTQLHVFYRNDGSIDEAAYGESVAGHLSRDARPIIVLTPIDSFPSAGIEVEIDAIAVSATERADGVGPGGAAARRHGEVVYAQAMPADTGADPAAQTTSALVDLFAALHGAGVGPGDICRLAAYARADLSPADHAACLDRLGAAFAEPGPVFETTLLNRLGQPGEAIRIEAVALNGLASGVRAVRRLGQGEHWCWPGGGPWSQAVRLEEMIFVGAQLPVDAHGALVHAGDLGGQTHAAMCHMRDALAAMGSGFAEVAKVNARFTGDWDEESWGLNVGIRSDYYGKPGPASTGIVTPRLEVADAMIQASCIAVAG
jgi:enamine deaminase RidA (YjgF/YER057c/UK114 family)